MANKEPITNFVLHDRHGREIDFSSFAVVGEVKVNLGDGIGEPTAESTYEGGKLTIDIDNIKGDGIASIEQAPSTEDAGINIVTITCESGATYQLQILNGSRGNGITAIETIVAEGDGGENIVRIKTNDNQEGITFKVKNGTKGSQGPQGPQGESVIVGEGDLPLDHVLGYDSTKAMSQRGIADGVESVKVGREQFVGYVAGEYVDNSNGNITPYSGWSRTNFLSVEGLSKLECTNGGSSTAYNCFYDVDRNFIARFTLSSGSNSIGVPEAARWCIVSQSTADIQKISFSNLPPIVGVDTKINGLELSVNNVYVDKPLYGGSITGGVWARVGSTAYKYKIISLPGASGSITIKAKSGLTAEVQCLSEHTPEAGTSSGILSNFPVVTSSSSATYQIPAGTNYLYVYWQTSGADRKPASITYKGVDLMGDFGEVARAILDISLPEPGTGILDFNPKADVEVKLGNLGRRYVNYGHSASEYAPVLTFIHMSDVHASNANILRVKEFYDEYQSYINGGVLDTGDWIGQNLANGLPSATESVPEFIRILGNHDAYYYPGHWELAPQTDCYNAFFKDYVENWGVVQPDGAEANGYCYFYKDYTANIVRLICLDGEHLRSGDNVDATQLAWLQDTLASARTSGLHVVVAIHRAPFALVPMPENPFDNIDFPNKSLTPYGGDHQPYTEAYMAVKSFIDAGGVFVCWLCGHMHDDYFGVGNTADTANQLVIGVSCASSSASATAGMTMERVTGQKSQDCFNVVGIDTHSKTIKLMRIGADYDRHMRRKNTLSWKYGTSQLIYVD